ncbi:hypothetical protein [Novosphingobium sp. MMS21-SN21R]|uniref:hypothetical protein n=1 Tax=Novosphingobium sp. MMS21-SN21R TaxID=2969298 RepID=UPI0028841AB6|nr:hypothetical protein [Novosphingobium sp. MMS21-SN21R]MDT0507446.1 hypothetical protein [Novosphingobium sp. MMS21-SN21R]
MLSLTDAPSIQRVMAQPLDPRLRTLLAERLSIAAKAGLQDLTHIVVVQPGDTIEDLKAEIGFSPVCNPIDGSAFGQEGFEPYWAWLADLGGWYELIHTIGDSGYAITLLVSKTDRVPAELLAMCAACVAVPSCA